MLFGEFHFNPAIRIAYFSNFEFHVNPSAVLLFFRQLGDVIQQLQSRVSQLPSPADFELKASRAEVVHALQARAMKTNTLNQLAFRFTLCTFVGCFLTNIFYYGKVRHFSLRACIDA